MLRYIDVVLVALAAPILLLIGVPPLGYAVGAGGWILLRAAGVAIDRQAGAIGELSRALTLRLVYALSRVFLLSLAIILVRKGAGKQDALTTLLVVLLAFTIQLAITVVTRPRGR